MYPDACRQMPEGAQKIQRINQFAILVDKMQEETQQAGRSSRKHPGESLRNREKSHEVLGQRS